MKDIEIKKSHIITFFLALKGTEGILNLTESRIRDSFLKKVLECAQEFETDRKSIYLKYCKRDEEGQPEMLEESYQFAKEDMEEVNEELKTLLEETVELKTPEGLKGILEKTEYKPKTGEVELIDDILALL